MSLIRRLKQQQNNSIMIHVMIEGRLGADPTPHEAYGNVTNINVAASQGRDREAVWFRCSAWDGLADRIRKWFKKGSGIIVHGRLSPTKYEKNGHTYHDWEVKLSGFDFPLSGGKKRDEDEVVEPEISEVSEEATVAHFPDMTEENR